MEQPKNTWDNASRKVLNEAGLEKAPVDLLPNIMDAIAKVGIHNIQYSPLISKKAWMYSILAVVAIFTIIVFGVPVEKYYLEGVDLSFTEKISALFSSIQISKTAIYGIGFLGLFLIQIPFLKRLLEGQTH